MNELNLEVGQKLWSIQLGDCVVENIGYIKDKPFVLTNGKERRVYWRDLKHSYRDAYRSVFESNPFNQPVFIPPFEQGIESKPEMIKALCMVAFQPPPINNDIIVKAREKLLNLLESI